jgi:hypothetical protein
MSADQSVHHPLLRQRDGHHARGTLISVVVLIVSFVEWRVVRRFRAKQANAVVEH